MTLKILGGQFKGRILFSPKTDSTRPTLAILRQAIFNMLQEDIQGAHILDLYAGSGAIGFEALSRGAASVTFIESDKKAFHCITQNIGLLKVHSLCTLLSYDALLALKKLAKTGVTFDMVYADPPYNPAIKLKLLEELLLFFDNHRLLRSGGRLFLEEASPGVLFPQNQPLSQLRYVDSRRFSKSLLHQFQNPS